MTLKGPSGIVTLVHEAVVDVAKQIDQAADSERYYEFPENDWKRVSTLRISTTKLEEWHRRLAVVASALKELIDRPEGGARSS